MTQSNKKANRGDLIDRISALPSHVIDGILRHLPVTDLIKTSVLSRNWRYMWASVPRLEFGTEFFEKCEHPEIPRIITEVLLLHNVPVREFCLVIPSDYHSRIRCLDNWILFFSRSGVTSLDLANEQNEPYQMPSHLFACQELDYLELHHFELSLPPNFCGFRSLIELHLYFIRFGSDKLESLISSSPLLDALTISFCSGFEYIDFSAPSLKDLYIEGAQVIKSTCLQKSKNLTYLTILANKSGKNFETDEMSNLIKALLKVEWLCLGEVYIKILSAGTITESLDSLKHLELRGVDFNVSGEILFIICLLKISPNLVDLVIKGHSKVVGPLPVHLKELECLSCCLSQLKTVNISVGTANKHALDLVRFLLANAPSLEILTFKVGLGLKQSHTPQLLSLTRQLLQMGRASQKAEVKFLNDGLVE